MVVAKATFVAKAPRIQHVGSAARHVPAVLPRKCVRLGLVSQAPRAAVRRIVPAVAVVRRVTPMALATILAALADKPATTAPPREASAMPVQRRALPALSRIALANAKGRAMAQVVRVRPMAARAAATVFNVCPARSMRPAVARARLVEIALHRERPAMLRPRFVNRVRRFARENAKETATNAVPPAIRINVTVAAMGRAAKSVRPIRCVVPQEMPVRTVVLRGLRAVRGRASVDPVRQTAMRNALEPVMTAAAPVPQATPAAVAREPPGFPAHPTPLAVALHWVPPSPMAAAGPALVRGLLATRPPIRA